MAGVYFINLVVKGTGARIVYGCETGITLGSSTSYYLSSSS